MTAGFFKKFTRKRHGSEESESGTRYFQRPCFVKLGKEVVIIGDDGVPQVLNEVGAFMWKQLDMERTESDLVSALVREYDVSRRRAAADVRGFLGGLKERGFVIEIPPGDEVPRALKECTEASMLLSEAHRQQQAGDWQAMMALCVEARKDPTHAPIAELDILIARYHLDRHDGLVDKALTLMTRLPAMAQVACCGIAMLSAFHTKDFEVAKKLAVRLAQVIKKPVDLPTLPTFVALAGERVIVLEKDSVVPILPAIRRLQDSVSCTDEERSLLAELVKRYEIREAM